MCRQQQRNEHREATAHRVVEQPALRRGDEPADRPCGFSHRKRPDDIAAVADGRGNVEHQGLRVARLHLRRPRAILALQRQTHIAPFRVVRPFRAATVGIEHHAPGRIGHIHAQIDLRLLQRVDLRKKRLAARGGIGLAQRCHVEGPIAQLRLQHRRQQPGGIHQRLLHTLKIARAYL